MTEDVIPSSRPIMRFAKNESGRDFVVGDIHGMFDHLSRLIARINFDPTTDRLFSVGDLVDRGPQSDRALEWLGRSWFHACRGNHEQFALDSTDASQMDLWVSQNGGEWWLDIDEDDRKRFIHEFKQMPIAMEVDTDDGTVGIVHADVPPLVTWEEFTECVEAAEYDAIMYAIWSRNRISGAFTPKPVSGKVVRVYCGHTPTRETVRVGNVCYLDTGAVYCFDGYEEARLTLIQISPGPEEEFYINTFEPKE